MTRIKRLKIRNFSTRSSVFLTAGVLSLGVLLAGCSTNAPTPAAAALNQTELTFNLSQCLPIDAHVWKCPAVDKPICDADYAGGTYTQCIRLGKKGSVYVTGPGVE
ncbi:MAG TPA: hypothetical protein VMV27_10235 [Candidatus Binataceae bacterium]|nr:hypothetical protein [Candidatus Binataceae bacterium]